MQHIERDGIPVADESCESEFDDCSSVASEASITPPGQPRFNPDGRPDGSTCPNRRCSYGYYGYLIKGKRGYSDILEFVRNYRYCDEIYWCEKCEDFLVCHECVDQYGKHKRHHDFLRRTVKLNDKLVIQGVE